MSHIKLLPLGLAGLLAAPILAAGPQVARADVGISLGGHVRVDVRIPRVRVRSHAYGTHSSHARLHVGGLVGAWLGGGLYIGGGFAQPPPPAPEPYDATYECDPAPAPVQPYQPPVSYQPAPVMVSAAAHAPVLPRFGIGAFAGSTNIDGLGSGDDVGLTARYRLTHKLYLEGEMAKSQLRDMDRTERRMGLGLLYDFNPHAKLSLHLLGALGMVAADASSNNSMMSEQGYGEVGAGLTYRITPHFQLAADLRAGSLSGDDSATIQPTDGVARSIVAPDNMNSSAYTRARLSALFFF